MQLAGLPAGTPDVAGESIVESDGTMAIQTAEDLFLSILSHLHSAEQRTLQIVEEMSQQTQDKEVKELLDLRAYLQKQEISNIEECFRILGKQPTPPITRFFDVLVEDFRRELSEIPTPALRALYILRAIRRAQEFHIAEYGTLVAMAGLVQNLPVAMLLERNLTDKMIFAERTRELIREIGRNVFAARMMQKVA